MEIIEAFITGYMAIIKLCLFEMFISLLGYLYVLYLLYHLFLGVTVDVI